jgi:hypothetical protein
MRYFKDMEDDIWIWNDELTRRKVYFHDMSNQIAYSESADFNSCEELWHFKELTKAEVFIELL